VEVRGVLVAGPNCPVEKQPPDPNCLPRQVEGATVKASDSAGSEQARAVSDADGTFVLELEPGEYTIAFDPVEGLLGAPQPIEVTVASQPVDLGTVAYDTGIR
jgi:hypothetical protein